MGIQKITEKRLLAVDQQLLLTDGTVKGEITVDETSLFRVGQVVTLASDTQEYATFKVKRILKNSIIFLGDECKPIQQRSDLSTFLVADNAVIFAREQKRPLIPEQEIERYTYEEEPVVARRVVLVDKYGERVSEDNPMPVLPVVDGGNTPLIYKETTVGTFIPITNKSKIYRLLGDAKTFGVWRMYRNAINDANLLAVDRTSPMHGMGNIKLEQVEGFNLTDKLYITFQAERYRSNILGASAKTFIRLEGYIES